MTTEPIPPAISTSIEGFAFTLTSLGNHARAMDAADEAYHDECSYCETMKLLSRVVGFGRQLRDADRDRRGDRP